ERPRGPVDRVLQHARDRRVVLGRREEDAVGAGDRGAETRRGRGRRIAVVVLVVRRYGLQAVPELDLDVLAGDLRRRAQQLRVVRLVAQAAGDGGDLRSATPP